MSRDQVFSASSQRDNGRGRVVGMEEQKCRLYKKEDVHRILGSSESLPDSTPTTDNFSLLSSLTFSLS